MEWPGARVLESLLVSLPLPNGSGLLTASFFRVLSTTMLDTSSRSAVSTFCRNFLPQSAKFLQRSHTKPTILAFQFAVQLKIFQHKRFIKPPDVQLVGKVLSSHHVPAAKYRLTPHLVETKGSVGNERKCQRTQRMYSELQSHSIQ